MEIIHILLRRVEVLRSIVTAYSGVLFVYRVPRTVIFISSPTTMATANSGKIWRCEIFGCNDPFFPRGSERHATYAEKRRSHHENVHSQQTTVNWDGSKVAVRRDSHTGLFYCPCRAPKHARRNGRHLRAICRLKTHPPRGKTGGLEDTEDEDEDGDEGDMSGHNGRASGDEDTSYEPDEGDHSEEESVEYTEDVEDSSSVIEIVSRSASPAPAPFRSTARRPTSTAARRPTASTAARPPASSASVRRPTPSASTRRPASSASTQPSSGLSARASASARRLSSATALNSTPSMSRRGKRSPTPVMVPRRKRIKHDPSSDDSEMVLAAELEELEREERKEQLKRKIVQLKKKGVKGHK